MNLNFTSIIILAWFSIIILVSCESHEQKADVAFERVKEEKMMPQDSVISDKKEVIKVNENIDEWSKFNIEIENKIIFNENKIKKIRSIPNTNAELLRKVTFLEKDNNDLRVRMAKYNEEVEEKWVNFREKMNHDVDELSKSFKDLPIKNDK